jgi:glyoxylase-like metal-dependent hydrolase (beta-lactamase superfamily II)
MEIVPGMHQVDRVNCNVYVVGNEEELAVVDTGMPRNTGRILNCIHNLRTSTLLMKKLVVSHDRP